MRLLSFGLILGLMIIVTSFFYMLFKYNTEKKLLKCTILAVVSTVTYILLFAFHAWLSGIFIFYHAWRYGYDFIYCVIFVFILVFIQRKYLYINYYKLVIVNFIVYLSYTFIKYMLLFKIASRS